ncbi:MAG: CoA pyrophosphatase [Rubrimonas sp.]|uniref:CoA pyrophosphatase n=1 Tax=Rubrimonas sp. TaxID=2036015 RepID=UPI002FDE29E6
MTDPRPELHREFRIDEAALRRALLAPVAAPGGDGELDPEGAPELRRLRPAAVLAAVARRPQGLTLILTQRPQTMRVHAGQIAFPGGKIDAGDRSPLHAALREAREEIGLHAHEVEILGPFERYVTRTGFAIAPFVGLVDAGFRPIPQPGEVEAVFEAPLDWVLNPANQVRMRREFNGAIRSFWAIHYERWFIWGATAGMIRRLSERVTAQSAAAATATGA